MAIQSIWWFYWHGRFCLCGNIRGKLLNNNNFLIWLNEDILNEHRSVDFCLNQNDLTTCFNHYVWIDYHISLDIVFFLVVVYGSYVSSQSTWNCSSCFVPLAMEFFSIYFKNKTKCGSNDYNNSPLTKVLQTWEFWNVYEKLVANLFWNGESIGSSICQHIFQLHPIFCDFFWQS